MTEQLERPASDSTGTAGGAAITPTQKLRDQLSAFCFNEALTPSLRRSPRNHSRFVKFDSEEEDSSLPSLASDTAAPSASKKRARSALATAVDGHAPSKGSSPKKRRSESVPAKKRKGKPGVAPPEKYAHLKDLTDYLGEGPDKLNGEPDAILCALTHLMSCCGTLLSLFFSAVLRDQVSTLILIRGWDPSRQRRTLNSTLVPARCLPP